MINEKIKAVFQFIDFLHSNIENFKSYIPLVEGCLSIGKEMDALNHKENFKYRSKYKELNELKNKQIDKINENVTQVIIGKAFELDICRYRKFDGRLEFNWGRDEIVELKENAIENDLSIINDSKDKYLTFKYAINSNFLSLDFFFLRLHEYLKEIFVDFDETALKDFEADSIKEAIETCVQQNWELDDHLEHYRKTKRIHFQSILNEFHANEFHIVNERLEKYKERYKYIYDRLENLERIEIKNDALDNLKKVVDYQTITKFKVLLKSTQDFISNYPSSTTLPPQGETISIKFKNNFDNVDAMDIYNHFKTGLVDKGYLNEQDLRKYLKTAFELQTIPKTLFKFKHTPTKQTIYTVFYVYYKDVSGKKHKRQIQYAALLGNYFDGYNINIIKTNWAREYRAKR